MGTAQKLASELTTEEQQSVEKKVKKAMPLAIADMKKKQDGAANAKKPKDVAPAPAPASAPAPALAPAPAPAPTKAPAKAPAPAKRPRLRDTEDSHPDDSGLVSLDASDVSMFSK